MSIAGEKGLAGSISYFAQAYADIAATDFKLFILQGTGPAYLASVSATCTTAGAAGNVAADTLVYLDQPIGGVSSVTNVPAATGGTDTETLDSLKARAPDVLRANDRAVTLDDFERMATDDAGVIRAVAAGTDTGGSVDVYILATDLNQTNPDTALRTRVHDALVAATFPGVAVNMHQNPVRLIKFTSIEIQYDVGADLLATQTGIDSALASYLDATTWKYGDLLYLNEVVGEISRVAGVKRVGLVKYQYSDDYGAISWTLEATLDNTGIQPGATPTYGVFQYYGGAAFPTATPIDFITL